VTVTLFVLGVLTAAGIRRMLGHLVITEVTAVSKRAGGSVCWGLMSVARRSGCGYRQWPGLRRGRMVRRWDVRARGGSLSALPEAVQEICRVWRELDAAAVTEAEDGGVL
jgi:hypothetical protein